jgi:hypothetical protein
MLSWVHWFNRPQRYMWAFAALKILTFLEFAQLLILEERDFLKDLRISPS